MDALTAALEASGPAQFFRQSWWAYPLLNIAHLIGLSGLFGAVLVLDLRLLGAWQSAPLAILERPLAIVAASGLVAAALTGGLLFAVRASEYAGMAVFWWKLGFIAVGVINAAAMRLPALAGRLPRLAGALSLTAWLAAIAAGRLIGYWDA